MTLHGSLLVLAMSNSNEGEFLVENSGQDVLKGKPFWQRINLKSTLAKPDDWRGHRA
ncbi:hypothetical protein CFII64_22745 [Pseudomonas sp. CFII64]|jgi:hypothetical protein|nr:hypothetical protein CFII64_22745 [Pseudomonas sp. CFII64]